ncbi:hypothetical protein ECE50_027095 [Chitinophaga sp. Mgbs1]|uniref:Uncharacterized protein n=1 Tax=Chitinophaga solisilvae TaxID=1233460 RepID=A0A433WIR0_9BACT|nr:hypothetical protein [Chitinophaga solisilvae]
MKTGYTTKITAIILLMAVLTPLLHSCRKVDDNEQLVASQPWFADTYNLEGRYGIAEWSYPRMLVIGDTAMLIGKFFTEKPGSEILIGGVPVKITEHITLDPGNKYNTGGLPLQQMDLIRFVVTKEMGTGARRDITAVANGVRQLGKQVSIQAFAATTNGTDSTLTVTEIGSWEPADQQLFLTRGYSYIRSSHVDMSGNLLFDNILGLYMLRNKHVKTVMKAGDVLKDDKGADFTVTYVLGSALSFDGAFMYISLSTKENTPDANEYYTFRLLKMDVASGVITTINRTPVIKGRAAVSNDGRPYTGQISQLKIVTTDLNLDINNNLFYANHYAPEDKANGHEAWYIFSTYGSFNSLQTVCRMGTGGEVRVLMKNWTSEYNSPGEPVAVSMYTLDPAGRYIYAFKTPEGLNTYAIRFDVEEEDVLNTLANFSYTFTFRSFEKDPALKNTSPVEWYGDYTSMEWNPRLVLSDGTLLNANTASLKAFDFDNMSVYCYAGSELGLAGGTEKQDQVTGKAKWVNFYDMSFNGTDKNNAVYFCRGMEVSGLAHNLRFYRMAPAGK